MTINQAIRTLISFQLPFSSAFQKDAGLSTISTLLENIPLKIPSDVYTYFTWLAISDDQVISSNEASGWLFHNGHLLTLDRAIQKFAQEVEFRKGLQRQLTISAYLQDSYYITDFSDTEKITWLPLFVTGGSAEFRVICDNFEQRETAPIYYHAYDGGLTYLAFDSLTALLQTTVDAYAAGAYTIQQDNYYVTEDRVKVAPILNRYNPRRREYFLHFAQANTVAEVVQQLDNQDRVMRHHAIRALSHLYEPETVPLLIERLQHPSAEQRETIVDLLGVLEDAQAIEPLIPLLRDPVPAVQLAALNALVQFRDRRTAEPLRQLLSVPDEKIRERAVFGLGELHVQSAVPALITVLTTAVTPRLRWETVVTLGKIGSPEAVPALMIALQDEDVSVSGSAAKALGQIGDARAIESLETFAKVPRPAPLASITQLALDALDNIRVKSKN